MTTSPNSAASHSGFTNKTNAPVITGDDSLLNALSVMESNSKGYLVVIDSQSSLLGVLTEGDIRRCLLTTKINLSHLCKDVCNKSPVTVDQNTSKFHIIELLERYSFLPLLDEAGRLLNIIECLDDISIPICEPNLVSLELSSLVDCVQSTWISSQGQYLTKFLDGLNSFTGAKYGLLCSNGTSALYLALKALDVGKGDEVIIPSMTFAATINAVLLAGATPVIADIDKTNACLCLNQVQELTTSRTRCIIPVHLYGYPINTQPLIEFAHARSIFVVEDCAEALGSISNGQHVGYYADCATFSFFGNKTITTGEGGYVTFTNKAVMNKALKLRDHGMDPSKRYWHTEFGFNFRMTNLQASLGFAQITRVNELVGHKIRNANLYRKFLAPISHIIKIIETENTSDIHSYWLFTISIIIPVDIPTLMSNMRARGIETRRVFYPLEIMPPYKSFSSVTEHTNSHQFFNSSLSLPSSTLLSEDDIQYISVSLINELNNII